MISLKSKITRLVLGYFLLNPHKRHYVNEIARMFSLDPKNLHAKLKELEKEGLLKSEFVGNARYFSLNGGYPLLAQYQEIFLKTIGLEKRIADALKSTPGIQEAYIFGSYAKNAMDAASDIDVLAVGDHSAIALQKEINGLQREIGREINVINMSREEFARKRRASAGLVKNILSGRYIKVL